MREFIQEYFQTGLIAFLIGASLIEIAPIKINPWSWLANKIGKAINSDVIKKLDEVEKRLDKHIKMDEEENIRNIRQRILRFDTECCRGDKHTLEHFNEVLEDIDNYEKYCDSHPDYKNSKAMSAIKTIKRVYDECKEKNSFL